MKPVLRNALSVIAGLVVGGVANMSLIQASGAVIPPPPGADVTTLEGLRASMHLFEPRHFVFPFLAHALGTLAGAWLAATLAASRPRAMALIIGCAFCAGGLANVIMLPAPAWFVVLDLAGAYFPMAWLGARLAPRRRSSPVASRRALV
jgi:hypothetical protein